MRKESKEEDEEINFTDKKSISIRFILYNSLALLKKKKTNKHRICFNKKKKKKCKRFQ